MNKKQKVALLLTPLMMLNASSLYAISYCPSKAICKVVKQKNLCIVNENENLLDPATYPLEIIEVKGKYQDTDPPIKGTFAFSSASAYKGRVFCNYKYEKGVLTFLVKKSIQPSVSGTNNWVLQKKDNIYWCSSDKPKSCPIK